MSPEGLNQRFKGSAVQFLQQVLANLLTQRIHSTQEILHPYSTTFKRIRILDSTTFQLPERFASHYQDLAEVAIPQVLKKSNLNMTY